MEPPGRAAWPPLPQLGRSHTGKDTTEASRVRLAGAGGSILLVLESLVSLVLQSRLGGKGGFPTRDRLEAGPFTRASLGTRRLVSRGGRGGERLSVVLG